jgi:hypothetical protein
MVMYRMHRDTHLYNCLEQVLLGNLILTAHHLLQDPWKYLHMHMQAPPSTPHVLHLHSWPH